jgi:hypothetical protein
MPACLPAKKENSEKQTETCQQKTYPTLYTYFISQFSFFPILATFGNERCKIERLFKINKL